MKLICTTWDDWLQEQKELVTLWTVRLTDGTEVYQDDGRPGIKPESAWTRLKNYCEQNDLGIDFMRISFRRNNKDVGHGADGFFFCKSLLCGIMASKGTYYYVVGTINDGVLTTTKWEVPSLLDNNTEERDINEYNDCIIWKPEKKKLWLQKNESTNQDTAVKEL